MLQRDSWEDSLYTACRAHAVCLRVGVHGDGDKRFSIHSNTIVYPCTVATAPQKAMQLHYVTASTVAVSHTEAGVF